MRLAPLLSYGVLFWVAAVIAAPLLIASGLSAPALAGVVIYRAASVVCHQIPQRSFQLSALPVAVCARCLGLYVGSAAVSIGMMRVGSGVRGSASGVGRLSGPALVGDRTLLVLAALPTMATWVAERSGLWAGTNVVRFAAALPLGCAAAWIVLAALRAETADQVD